MSKSRHKFRPSLSPKNAVLGVLVEGIPRIGCPMTIVTLKTSRIPKQENYAYMPGELVKTHCIEKFRKIDEQLLWKVDTFSDHTYYVISNNCTAIGFVKSKPKRGTGIWMYVPSLYPGDDFSHVFLERIQTGIVSNVCCVDGNNTWKIETKESYGLLTRYVQVV